MKQECFLLERTIGECGSDRGTSVCVSLCDCNDDVSGHLAGCHLSRECLAEHQLILARAGLFHLTDDQLHSMKICPKHLHNLGRFWRPVRSYQYPIHRYVQQGISHNKIRRKPAIVGG